MKIYGAGIKECKKHGNQQIDWKCNFCCSIALYHCFGTTYFCKKCHDERDPSHPKIEDCGGVNCPLGIPHPPASKDLSKSTFPLGCGICRSERLAKLNGNANIIQEVVLQPENKQAKPKVEVKQQPQAAARPRPQAAARVVIRPVAQRVDQQAAQRIVQNVGQALDNEYVRKAALLSNKVHQLRYGYKNFMGEREHKQELVRL